VEKTKRKNKKGGKIRKMEDKIHLIAIGNLKIYNCPNCGAELDHSLVDSTEPPYQMCGECGLIFDHYPKKIKFSK